MNIMVSANNIIPLSVCAILLSWLKTELRLRLFSPHWKVVRVQDACGKFSICSLCYKSESDSNLRLELEWRCALRRALTCLLMPAACVSLVFLIFHPIIFFTLCSRRVGVTRDYVRSVAPRRSTSTHDGRRSRIFQKSERLPKRWVRHHSRHHHLIIIHILRVLFSLEV